MRKVEQKPLNEYLSDLRPLFGTPAATQATARPEPAPSPTPGASKEPAMIKIEMSRHEFEAFYNPPPEPTFGPPCFAVVSKEGKPCGIKMTHISNRSLMHKLKFQPGDVLLSINNKRLSFPEEFLMAAWMIKSEKQVDFKIDRGGRIIHRQLVIR